MYTFAPDCIGILCVHGQSQLVRLDHYSDREDLQDLEIINC